MLLTDLVLPGMSGGQLAGLGAGYSLSRTGDHREEARYRAGVDVLILGGRPIREPVAMYGPFVMNTRDQLIQAFEDYQSGRLGVIPAGRAPHLSDGS